MRINIIKKKLQKIYKPKTQNKNSNKNIASGIFLAIILGTIIGILFNNYAKYFELPAQIFIRLLKMIIVPTIFFSIIHSIISNKSGKNILTVSLKGIILYTLTSIVAAIIGISIGFLCNKFFPINLSDIYSNTTIPDKTIVNEKINIKEIILSIIPLNPAKALAQGNLMQIIFFSIILGFGIRSTDKLYITHNFFSECNNIVMQIVSSIIKLSPIGIFSLSVWIIGTQDAAIIMSVLQVLLMLIIGGLIQFIFVYGSLLIYKKVKLISFIKKMFPIQIMAFSTSSSNATLPFTMKISKEKLHISKNVANIILPMGATMNMDGLVIFLTSSTVFLSGALGIALGFSGYIILMTTAVLVSVGTAAVPNVGLVSLTAILKIFNIPIDVFTIFAGIDRFRDMVSTTINVSGDVIISKAIDEDTK